MAALLITAMIGNFLATELQCQVFHTDPVDQKLISKLEKLDCEKPHLRLNSHGGSAADSLTAAYIIRSKNVAVTIDRYCFSSCVEFIIPSSPKVILENDPIIGVHGNPVVIQEMYRAGYEDIGAYCPFTEAEDMRTLYKVNNADIEFWRLQTFMLKVKNYYVAPPTNNECPKHAIEYEYDYWMPSANILRQYLNPNIIGDTCTDTKACGERELRKAFRGGKFLVGQEPVNLEYK